MNRSTDLWQVRAPQTEAEWLAYYQLRWEILRQPWGMAKGSEQDELEQQSQHLLMINQHGLIGAVGRVHMLDNTTAQIRYMAVSDLCQGQGLGAQMVAALEQEAAALGCDTVVLNARESATGFYQKQGYQQYDTAPALLGIAHYRMRKPIRLAGTAEDYQSWARQLVETWHSTIPLSKFMQLNVASFDGRQLCCQAPMEPNINLHHTMFAGSIYTLATLTGWGLQYLQLKAAGLSGSQVLADAEIHYRKPVILQPQGRSCISRVEGELAPLLSGRKAIQRIEVDVFSGDELAATFSGRYVVLPSGK